MQQGDIGTRAMCWILPEANGIEHREMGKLQQLILEQSYKCAVITTAQHKS